MSISPISRIYLGIYDPESFDDSDEFDGGWFSGYLLED